MTCKPSLVYPILVAISFAAALAPAPACAAEGGDSAHAVRIDPSVLPLVMVLPPLSATTRIAIDPATRKVAIDSGIIAHLEKGKLVSIAIVGAGRFDFVVDYVNQDNDVLAVGGHAPGNPAQRLTLGIRSDGVTGLIETPKHTYALGYSNRVQMAGIATTQWMADDLAGRQTSMQSRSPAQGEHLPALGAEPVSLDIGRLVSMSRGEETVMHLTGIGATRVQFDEIRPGDTSATWVGHLKDFGETYKVLLTYSTDATEGYFVTPKGEITLMANASGDLYQFNASAAGYRNMAAEGECAVAGMPAMSSAAATVAGTSSNAAPIAANAGAGSPTIDVLVYYTPGMLSAYGSIDKLTTRIDSLLAAANQAYIAGGLSYQVRRVGLEMVSINDRTSNDSVLVQMRSHAGAFSGMAQKRDQLGADLVTLIRPLYAQSQGSCGVGYVSGSGATNVGQYADYGYSVVSDGNDRAGLNAYCDPLSMTHELGHNMGLMHDRATVAKQGGGVGATSYAYGHAVAGRWGTIMSYTTPRVIKFSNPNDYTCGTQERCGVPETSAAGANNAMALAATMPLVAGFRSGSAAAQSYGITGVVTLNGQPASGIAIGISNVSASSGAANAALVSCQPSGGTGVFNCSAPAGYSFTLTPVYSASANTSVAWTPASAAIKSIAGNQTVSFSGTSKSTLNGSTTPNSSGSTAGQTSNVRTLTISISLNGQNTLSIPFSVLVSGMSPSQFSCAATASRTVVCNMPVGGSATVTMPAATINGRKATFTPTSLTVSKISSNQTMVFAGRY